MLPDFPKIKRKSSRIFIKYLKDSVARGSFLSEIKSVRHFEGSRMSTQFSDGQVDLPGYKQLSSALSIKDDDLIRMGPNAFKEGLDRVAKEFQEQQSKLVFERMNEVTEKTGNTVDAKGQPFSYDMLLEMLDKMQIDFDERGQPVMPTIVLSPLQHEKLKERIVEWEQDPECQEKFNRLMKAKRREWDDRESDRKLVD